MVVVYSITALHDRVLELEEVMGRMVAKTRMGSGTCRSMYSRSPLSRIVDFLVAGRLAVLRCIASQLSRERHNVRFGPDEWLAL